jgi:serine protease Do
VDGELQHDAAISPGSSGGPLVDEEGRVVAVNYASASEEGPHFAIAAGAATPIVERLRAGELVTYLGINGQAIADGDGTSGVWVAAVESGSPAAEVGLQGGDLITRMEGLAVGTDGTMAGYCDVLRTQGSDGPIGLQVVRDATQEILQGTLNNGDVLEPFQTLTGEAEDDTSAGGEEAPTRYSEYIAVVDDSDTIELEVPVSWAEVDGAPIEIQGEHYPGLVAAPDLDGFFETYSVPGVQIIGFDDTGAAQQDTLLDSVVGPGTAIGDACTSEGREPYEDAIYRGRMEILNDCAGTASSIAAIAAGPEDGTFTVLVIVQLVSEADFEALDQVIATFVYRP